MTLEGGDVFPEVAPGGAHSLQDDGVVDDVVLVDQAIPKARCRCQTLGQRRRPASVGPGRRRVQSFRRGFDEEVDDLTPLGVTEFPGAGEAASRQGYEPGKLAGRPFVQRHPIPSGQGQE